MRNTEESSINLSAMSTESGLLHLMVRENRGYLDRLPVELTIKVLCRLHDLVSLDSLIRASPTAYRVFASYAVEVTEAVLQREYPHIRVVFRYLALLRSGTFPAMSYSDFVERVIKESMRYATRVRCSRSGFVPKRLAQDTEPAVIRSVLSTARLVKCVALGCLDFYLARFKALRPERPADKNHDFLLKRNVAKPRGYIPPWQARPEGAKIEVRDVGPPSWDEEQRATRAFWRLHFICELKQAAANGMLAWEENDIASLQSTTLVSTPMDRDDEVVQACGSPLEARYRPHRRSMKGYHYKGDFYNPFWTHMRQGDERALPAEYEEFVSVVDYVREAYGSTVADRLVNGQLCLTELGGPHEVHRSGPGPAWPTSRQWKDLVGASHGVCRYFWSTDFVPIRGRDFHSRLPFIGFDVFGRYGFAFWSTERMRAYGLEPLRTDRFWEEIPLVHYTWESILRPEDIARMEQESREYFSSS